MRHALFTLTLVASAVTAGLPAAHAAGQVEVKYVQPEKFRDVGFGTLERERNLDSLTLSFQRLGQQLPEGQTLKIEVLDVDLAGEVQPGSVRDIRIVRGGIDWPRIDLRYSLQAGDTVLKVGQEKLSDMAYLFSHRAVGQREGNLPYEHRLIERWFANTITSANP